MSKFPNVILNEIQICFANTDFSGNARFVNYINNHNKVLLIGSGRVGLVMRTFAMRLMHLGFDAHYLGDVTVPNFRQGDLILIGSGSGATRSILNIAEIALTNDLDIALITSSPNSPIGKIANIEFVLSAPSKQLSENRSQSIQPMTSLFEQTLQIYLDSLVLELMEMRKMDSREMWERHNAIE